MINIGPITALSTAARNAHSNAANALVNTGAGAPHFIIQTAGGALNLLDFTLDGTSAFGVSSSGVITLDISPTIMAAATNGGTPARWVLTDSDGTVHYTGIASGDPVQASFAYAIGNFALQTPVS